MRDNYLMGSYKYDGPFFKIPWSMKFMCCLLLQRMVILMITGQRPWN